MDELRVDRIVVSYRLEGHFFIEFNFDFDGRWVAVSLGGGCQRAYPLMAHNNRLRWVYKFCLLDSSQFEKSTQLIKRERQSDNSQVDLFVFTF